MRINNYAVLGRVGPKSSVSCPENGKTFILETRMPQKGTCLRPQWHRLHPLKTAKHLFWKQGCPKKGQSFFAKKSITFDKFIEIIVKL